MSQIIAALYIVTTSLALIVLKLGSKTSALISFSGGKLSLNLNLYTVLGIVLFGTSFLLYTYLISSYDLGYIIPLLAGFVYLLVFLASYFLFKESFTLFKVGGILLILIGLVFLNLGSK